jgi:hypothetical protein
MVAPETAIDRVPGLQGPPRYMAAPGLITSRLVDWDTVPVAVGTRLAVSPPGLTSARADSAKAVGISGW